MKKLSLTLIMAAVALFVQAKEKLAVVNFDVVGQSLTEEQYVSLARTEIAKLAIYNVLDKYTVNEYLTVHKGDVNKCFGTNCLSELGKSMNSRYIVSGSSEIIVDKAIMTLRLIDTEKNEAIKTSYSEFYWNGSNAQDLIQIAVFKLFDKEVDQKLLDVYDYTLSKRGTMQGPAVKKLNLSGPRFGGAYLSGLNGEILSKGERTGGFDKEAFMSVIGYQFEKQYLHTGPFQAVLQMNFAITGLDQQLALPSLSVLNGFRSTVGGWEFGFGPSFRLKKTAKGFYRQENGESIWTLTSEGNSAGYDVKERLDSRGSTKLISSWVWGIGKSFKAGSMNIPVNFYTIPDKDGWLFGFSMGYALHMKKSNK